jgi:hypothetical protein
MTDTSGLLSSPPAPSPSPLLSSPTPRRVQAPSWLDFRLAVGVVLVLASVVGGALLFASADHRQARWSVTRDLAAGTVLTPADVRSIRVQLAESDSRYVPATEAVVGRALGVPLSAGQLLARADVVAAPLGVSVTIPLRPDNGPNISQGNRITVWLSTKSCQGVVLLSGVAVQAVSRADNGGFGSDAGSVLVVNVTAADAKRLVSALDLEGAVIRAGVLSAGQSPDPPAPDLAACAGGGA